MKYILELTRWRCGSTPAHMALDEELKLSKEFQELEHEADILEFLNSRRTLGAGGTAMLNGLGFSCCLGQFAMQVGVPSEKLLHLSYPGEVASALREQYDTTFVGKTGEIFSTNRVSSACAQQNDSSYFNLKHKIESLRSILQGEGHELEVQFKGKVVNV